MKKYLVALSRLLWLRDFIEAETHLKILTLIRTTEKDIKDSPFWM
jgi:hypothetical protein